MADMVLGFVLERSGDWLSEKAANFEKYQVHNVKVQVKKMRTELTMMKSYLKDTDARQSKEEEFGDRIKAMKGLAYRIEDVTETFDIHIESRNKISINEGSFKRILEKIIDIFDVKYLNSRKVQLEIDKIEVELTNLRKKKHFYNREEVLFWMRPEVEPLVGLMLQKRRNFQIISLHGTSDIGRIIFAEQLRKDDRVQRHFKVIACVDIPQEFTPGIIFERILRLFFNHPEPRIASGDMEEKELVNRLLKFQKRHRCLTVLGNVQSTDAWETLRIAFPQEEKTRSKLLITTGSLEVARIATSGEEEFIHTLRTRLTEEHAWEMVSAYANARDGPELNTVDSEMENIGRQLVTQREVLTPDILALGETMKMKHTREGWKMVDENNRESEETEKVQQALASTYNGLPDQLKSCLFYLATFPKGRKIEAEKIYHLWMAEGLMSSDNYQAEAVMHLGKTYLDELHLRGMVNVQEEEVTSAKRFQSCSLHNLIRNFCLFMGRQEEIFLVMEDGLEQNSGPFTSTNDIWRLVINVGKHETIKSLDCFNEKLRCLLVRNVCENQELEMLSYIINHMMNSKYLRIVDFDGIDFGSMTLPKGIADLVHLRYLSFLGCQLNKLPKSICKLPYLQILDLRVNTAHKMEIPNSFHKMERLKHLYLPQKFQTRGGVKLRLDGLTQLETLENFNTVVCDVEDLFKLTKVSHLTVNIEGSLVGLKRLADYMTSQHEVHSSLNVKKIDCYSYERHLVFGQLLQGRALRVLYMEGHLGKIPDKISESLTKMVLSGSHLQIDHMHTLEKLSKLQMLILTGDAFVGKKLICSRSNFPELRHLQLSNLSYLESWIVEETAMPKLSSLKIENCRKLKMLPDGF